MTGTSFGTGSSQVKKRGLHTLSQKANSSQYISVTVELLARRNSSSLCRRGKWCALCSGTNGHFLIDFLTRGETENAERYCVVLLHDNARPHSARRSTHFLQKLAWQVFNHPPYIPDLAPSDFYLFLHSKNSCPVSVNVFRTTDGRWWVSHSGSNPRRQNYTTQVYKIWSHGMTDISVPEVNMLKYSSTFAVSVTVNLSINWVLFL